MKSTAFVAALMGVVVGLAAGLLLWGGGPQSVPAAESPPTDALTDILSELRAINVQLAVAPRVSASTSVPETGRPVPLEGAVSVRQFEALSAAIDALTRSLNAAPVGAEPGIRSVTISPTAAATATRIRTSLERGRPVCESELFGLAPREVLQLMGVPSWVHPDEGSASTGWTYVDPADPADKLLVSFVDGYVYRVWRP